MDARAKPVFAQGDEGKFLAKENSLVCLLFLHGRWPDRRARGVAQITPLMKVRALPSLSAAADARRELPFPTHLRLSWIAILYALHKHFCWAFFDIRNEKYALDSGLAPN
jgi:hypothetical protein